MSQMVQASRIVCATLDTIAQGPRAQPSIIAQSTMADVTTIASMIPQASHTARAIMDTPKLDTRARPLITVLSQTAGAHSIVSTQDRL